MTIAAIETHYGGCRFRSRLEARWCVLFDRLHIKWQYEQQGYEVAKGEKYLPDFYLPELETYVEVKGDDASLAEDLPRMYSFVRKSQATLIVLGDVPRPADGLPFHTRLGLMGGSVLPLASVLMQTPKWDFVGLLVNVQPTTAASYLRGHVLGHGLANAYYSARSARFEHGETPPAPTPRKRSES